MFVSSGQFYVFLASVAFGGTAGVLLSVSHAVKNFFHKAFIGVFTDITVFIVTAAAFVFYSYALNFPSFRPYMAAGVFLGLFLYAKSYHILLAKPVKMLYNISRKTREKRRETKCPKRNSKDSSSR